MVEQFDLTDLVTATGGPAEQPVLRRLDAVCHENGAFGLTGLGLGAGLLARVHRDTLDFFALPQSAKAVLQDHGGDQFVGWKGSTDNRNEFGFPDYKEMFHIGPRVDPTLAGPDRAGRVPPVVSTSAVRCRLWPAELPAMIASWHEYYRTMQVVARLLGRAMASALEVPLDVWDALIADNWADLAANYYPPAGSGPSGVRNAVHSDLTMFTILYQDNGGGGGLHMQARDGRWAAVPASDAPFLVNVGELLTYLTSGRWWAAPHEVSEADPSAAGADTPRISIPFFYRPNDANTITPLLPGPESAECLEPIEVGTWVRNRKLLART